MKESNMPKADFVTSIFLIVFGIVVVYLSAKMPRFEEIHANPYSAPGVVPGLLGVTISFLGLILLVRSIIQKGYKLGLNRVTVKQFFREPMTRRILLTIFISVAYWALLGRIPFSLVTALYVFIFVIIFEYEKGKTIIQQRRMLLVALVMAVITSASVTYVFQYLFLVNLP